MAKINVRNSDKTYEIGLTASTIQTQGNGLLSANINEVSTVNNTGDVVTLPPVTDAFHITIINNGSNSMNIYPNTSNDLGAGVNLPAPLAANSFVIYVVYSSTSWKELAASAADTISAFGDMYEDNESGSAIDSTYKTWITATQRTVDPNGLVTFENNSEGDKLVLGSNAAGYYNIIAKCEQTNAGGNNSILTIHINGVDSSISSEGAGDSAEHRLLFAPAILYLDDNDYLQLHVVSTTASDVITSYHTSLTIQRISL